MGTPRRAVVQATIMVGVVLLVTEVAAHVAIRLSRPLLDEEIRTTRDILGEQTKLIRRLLEPDTSRMLAVHPLLGWRYRPGHRDSANTINQQGLRSDKRYLPRPPEGVTRVAAFGDSFVYGNEVRDTDAWSAQMEQRFPDLEVLNYGVGGYGVDQAYLRFCSEGASLAPHIVIIGFAPVDLRRVVNVYRRFISNREIPLAKPRFKLDARNQLVMLPNPVPNASAYERYLREPTRITELGANDHWYDAAIYRNPLYDYSATARLLTNLGLRVHDRYLESDRLFRNGQFDTASTAFRIHTALFDQFASAARAIDARPIVVIFPDRESVINAVRGHPTMFEPLVDYLAGRTLEHIDLTRAFVEAAVRVEDVAGWFMDGGHYSPTGNRIVAEWLGRAIRVTHAQHLLQYGYDDGSSPSRPCSTIAKPTTD